MVREKTVDLFILFLNVLAIMLLVGILSVMVTAAEADEPQRGLEAADTVINGLPE